MICYITNKRLQYINPSSSQFVLIVQIVSIVSQKKYHLEVMFPQDKTIRRSQLW